MIKTKSVYSVFILCITLTTLPVYSEYSPWSILTGLNLIWNSDGSGNPEIEGMHEDGTPGGLNSAPPPIAAYLGVEYRLKISQLVTFAPSASLYALQYRFEERPLPVEIEHRTAYVPSLFLDLPFIFPFSNEKLSWYVGAGPSILVRWAFLESDVPADAVNTDEKLSAGEQVDKINEYNWASLRWMYPTLQAGIRYELETGWGAGLSLRLGLPLFNAWSKPTVPFFDSTMFLLSLTITPPVRKAVENQSFLIE